MLRSIGRLALLSLTCTPVLAQFRAGVAYSPRPAGSIGELSGTAAAGPDGSLFLTAAGASSTGKVAATTVRVDATGSVVWTAIHPAALESAGFGVVAHPAGGCVITGYEKTSAGCAVLVVRYDAAGTASWTSNAVVGACSWTTGAFLAVDGSGNTCVAAGVQTSAGFSVAILRYSVTGALLWQQSITTGSDIVVPRGIVVDSRGAVTVAANVVRTTATTFWLVARYDSFGNQTWQDRLTQPSWSAALAVGPGDTIAVTGSLRTSSLFDDTFTKLYAPSGAVIWSAVDAGGGAGTAIGWDSRARVVGSTLPTASADARVWARTLGGTSSWSTGLPGIQPVALAIDPYDKTHVLGHTTVAGVPDQGAIASVLFDGALVGVTTTPLPPRFEVLTAIYGTDAAVSLAGAFQPASSPVLLGLVRFAAAPAWIPYANGCGGTLGSPRISGTATPTLGTSQSLSLTNAPPHQPALLLLSGQRDDLPVSATCRLAVSLTGLLAVPMATDATGAASVPVTFPSDPALIGVSAFAQGLVLDPTAPPVANLRLGISAALEARLAR